MNTEYVKGECFFTRTNKNKKQYEYFTDDIETDVIIAGGGVTGAIAAYYFSKHNIDCVVLEKRRVGHGSTSITTALLQYELDSNAQELKSSTSLENVEKSYKLGLKALSEIEDFIKENGNKCHYEKADSLLYTSKKLETKEIQQEYKFRKEAGLDVEYIDGTNSPYPLDINAGIISKNGGAKIDPYLFTHQLLEAACKTNKARVYENSEIVNINYGDNVTVETVYGHKVKGKIIICATGYNTKLFTDRNFSNKSTTFNIVTKPLDNINKVFEKVVIRDNEDPYNYLRTTADNRLILGGEDIDYTSGIYNEEICTKIYEKLECRLRSMFQDLDIEIDYRYCGTFASTKDDLGFLGKDPRKEKLWYMLGYGANGILFAILGGMMLSKLYLGEYDDNLNLFKPDRFDK